MREKIESGFWWIAQEREFLRPFGNAGRLAAALSVTFFLAAFVSKKIMEG
ncbi:hypothetical protein [Stenotrophomonas acidaminiphila]